MSDYEWISVTDTAKLIRAQLKAKFPGVKFSVKSDKYAGGASINVGWTDGPKQKEVEEVVGPFACGRFDGMIDMAYSVKAWLLPDGSAALGKSPGSEGSMGVEPGYNKPAPAGAKLVRFGADYVFCKRSYSLPVYTAAAEAVCKRYGIELPEIQENSCGPYVVDGWKRASNMPQDISTMIYRELRAE